MKDLEKQFGEEDEDEEEESSDEEGGSNRISELLIGAFESNEE